MQTALNQLKDRLKLLFKDEIGLVKLLTGSNQSVQKLVMTSDKLCMEIKIQQGPHISSGLAFTFLLIKICP